MATPQAVRPPAPSVSIMISYSRTDGEDAKRLWCDLNDHGFPTWMDQRDIPGGAHWDKEIRSSIEHAHVVLVVLSPASMKSQWVRKEYDYALSRHKVVIPLMYYPCDIPAKLAPLQVIDFRPNFFNAEAYYAQQLARLTDSITGYESLDMPHTPPQQSSRWGLPLLFGVMAVVGVVLAFLEISASGALLPSTLHPYIRPLLGITAVLFLGCGLGLGVRRARHRDGSISLYHRDRERFLTKVSTRYANRLKPPFAGALLLTLGLHEDAQALVRPSLARQDGSDTHPHPLPAGTGITQVFQEAEGQLLILGAPVRGLYGTGECPHTGSSSASAMASSKDSAAPAA